MLGHISIGVRDIEKARRFYDALFAPLGWANLWTDDDALGYGGADGNDKFAVFLKAEGHAPGSEGTRGHGRHRVAHEGDGLGEKGHLVAALVDLAHGAGEGPDVERGVVSRGDPDPGRRGA